MPLTDIQNAINKRFRNLEIRGFEVADAVRKGYVKVSGKVEDITDISDRILRSYTTKILEEISQMWPNIARLDALYFAGGGAELVGGRLAGEFIQGRVVKNPQFANVRGYLRFGRFNWKN